MRFKSARRFHKTSSPWRCDQCSSCSRVGLKLSSVEVRFENLSIDTNVRVGKAALPSVPGAMVDYMLVSVVDCAAAHVAVMQFCMCSSCQSWVRTQLWFLLAVPVVGAWRSIWPTAEDAHPERLHRHLAPGESNGSLQASDMAVRRCAKHKSEHCLPCTQGRLTLLLGPPGSGKSTLLKALSGKLDRGLHMDGEITYNGHRQALHSLYFSLRARHTC